MFSHTNNAFNALRKRWKRSDFGEIFNKSAFKIAEVRLRTYSFSCAHLIKHFKDFVDDLMKCWCKELRGLFRQSHHWILHNTFVGIACTMELQLQKQEKITDRWKSVKMCTSDCIQTQPESKSLKTYAFWQLSSNFPCSKPKSQPLSFSHHYNHQP